MSKGRNGKYSSPFGALFMKTLCQSGHMYNVISKMTVNEAVTLGIYNAFFYYYPILQNQESERVLGARVGRLCEYERDRVS